MLFPAFHRGIAHTIHGFRQQALVSHDAFELGNAGRGKLLDSGVIEGGAGFVKSIGFNIRQSGTIYLSQSLRKIERMEGP